MPVVSQAQNRAMRAAAEGHSTLGIPKSVGKEFVAATHGKKVSKLPERKQKKGHEAAESKKYEAKEEKRAKKPATKFGQPHTYQRRLETGGSDGTGDY